uniref:Uncharacterized protein n=1 Tax=Trichobilharzia regenti TaxID=157069 RepID=A0AA85J670_TRIRE|nr:unnamed protein product [Trichobilharzia regenti]
MWKVKASKNSKKTILKITSSRVCLRRFIIFTCLLVLMTMITTICTATITALQRLYDIFYVPFVFIVLGILSVIVFTYVEEIQERFPANYAFMALCILFESLGLPVLTRSLRWWTLLAWSLAIVVAVTALTIGYKMERRRKKVSIILLSTAGGMMVSAIIVLIALRLSGFLKTSSIISGLIVIATISIVLYIIGQRLQRCSEEPTTSLLPLGLSLLTWSMMTLVYLSISAMTKGALS